MGSHTSRHTGKNSSFSPHEEHLVLLGLDALSPAAEQTGNKAFDHRTAVAAGTGEMHLIRGPLAAQARRRQHPMNSVIKFFVLDGLSSGVVAVSPDSAPDSAF